LVLPAVGAKWCVWKAIRSVGMTFVMSSMQRFIVFPFVIGVMCGGWNGSRLAAWWRCYLGVVPTATSAYALASSIGP